MDQPTEDGCPHARPKFHDLEPARQWVGHIGPGLLPPECRLAAQRYDRPEFVPAPADAAMVSGAVEKRQREFSAGRMAARSALEKLGVPGAFIPIGPARNPGWPAGVVGSITHTGGLAVATVARQTRIAALGIDLELAQAVNEELWPGVFEANEIKWIRGQPSEEQQFWATVIFCAKESFYKLQYPVTNAWVDFHAAEVSVNPAAGEFHLVCSESLVTNLLGRARFSGRYACGHGFTLAAMHLTFTNG